MLISDRAEHVMVEYRAETKFTTEQKALRQAQTAVRALFIQVGRSTTRNQSRRRTKVL
jgi:hypothetical protein